MARLQVCDFSCIKSADITFDRLTVIIGPQASGKSVLCKLAYFFVDCALSQQRCLGKLQPFDAFLLDIKSRFCEWFPVGAWGKEKFLIEFEAGGLTVCLTRKSYRSNPSDDFRIKVSSVFEEQYESLLNDFRKAAEKQEVLEGGIEYDWKLSEKAAQSLRKLMGEEAIGGQVFIPAGRAFFTSVGKAIAAFEQGKVLDPLILRFGRMLASYRDNRGVYLRHASEHKTARKAVESAMSEIFGGELKIDGDKEYVATPDGRLVPLSALSSGQQELLPLVVVLPFLLGLRGSRMIYIEEPEAHLFPVAQSKLVQALAALLNGPSMESLVLTTHSPYVLSKINNLIKAGQIAHRFDGKKRELSQILPSATWLANGITRAYAIVEGELVDIMGSDGLIDADYLDSVSGDIGREFSRLLALEVQ